MNNISYIVKRFLSNSSVQRTIKSNIAKPFKKHEIKVGGVTQKWNYRSEFVNRDKLDKNHSFTLMAFAGFSIIGILSFVAIKTSVIEGRKEEMIMREKFRKELKLSGEDRKTIGTLDSTYKE
uniref:Uncharacterized protein n=1 Tax=Strongyloides papillosus TaxID=174720 RepID=A0A0N5BN58_STREA